MRIATAKLDYAGLKAPEEALDYIHSFGWLRDLAELGFKLVATRGTAAVLEKAGLTVHIVNKVQEGRPHIVDMIKNDEIDLILNTVEGRQATRDSSSIRRSAPKPAACAP